MTRALAALALAGRLLLVLAGAGCFAVAVRCFFLPNGLLSGGVGGTSLLLNELAGTPVGLVVLLLNLPIFALGGRVVGRTFAVFSGVAVVAVFLLIDFAELPRATNDPLLAAMFGGLFSGIGTALALRAGGSLGGFDILGVVLNRRFALGVGEVLLVLNGVLIAAKGLLGQPELAMYTLVGIYVTSRTIGAAQAARPRKAFLIVSARAEQIRARVLHQMRRGLTILRAEGGYAHDPTNVLLCVVSRPEIRELQDIIRAEDRAAFVVVLEASEIMGYFRESTRGDLLRTAGLAPLVKAPADAPE